LFRSLIALKIVNDMLNLKKNRSCKSCCFEQEDGYLLNDDGLPKPSYPDHWKGKNGLYCVGLSRRGLYGASVDAQNIANDIKSLM
jgi:hypothetical protein